MVNARLIVSTSRTITQSLFTTQRGKYLIILLLCISTFIQSFNCQELIVNPGTHSSVLCGQTQDCTIICTYKDACDDSTFNVINNVIRIECLGNSSCDGVNIIATNVKSLNFTSTNSSAFQDGLIDIRGGNGLISIQCVAQYACDSARFMYSQNARVTHKCEGYYACADVSILSFNPMSISCNASCPISIILAGDDRNSGDFIEFIDSQSDEILIFSIYHKLIDVDISASSGTLNAWIIYGTQFEDFCAVDDEECINSMEYIYDPNVTIFDTDFENFGESADFSSITSDKSMVLIFSVQSQYSILNPPFLTNTSSYISVLCLACYYYIDPFDFSNTSNVIVAAISLHLSNIYGPTNSFTWRNFDSNYKNNFYLENTKHVTINGMRSGTVYLEDNLNVNIECTQGIWDLIGYVCLDTKIYSSLDPESISLQTSGWNIDCSGGCDPEFLFLFDMVNITCGFIGNTPQPDCMFLSDAPTSTPSAAPTYSPTVPPTSAPTSPSYSPSIAPTHNPSLPPTHNPSFSPSNAPTNHPSFIPTDAPSYSPTVLPTIAPSFNPSVAPTDNPSVSPTNAPTRLPTLSPTIAPSNAPSTAPTAAPTRFPTKQNEYSQLNQMIFVIRNLTESNTMFLNNEGADQYRNNIQAIIKESYVLSAKYYVEEDSELEYRDFDIVINEDGITYNRYRNDYIMELISSLHYEEESVETIVLYISDKASFLNNVIERLMEYFNSDSLLLFTADMKTMEGIEAASDSVMYGLLIFMTFMCLGSMTAFVYNKKDGTMIDNAQWRVFMIFGLQIFDLVSDLNLSIEILLEFGNRNKTGNETYLYVSGIGSAFFIFLSYFTNIAVAANIKHIISENKVAVAFFEQKSELFILLVVFSGAAYPALALLSSRIFALEIFNCGLTLYEMRQLSNLKIFGSVLLENIPQLIFQIFYIIYLGGTPTKNTLLSFTASFLSIVVAVLSHCVGNKSSNLHISQYDLQFTKKPQPLTDEEREKIDNKKECKNALKTAISSAVKGDVSHLELELGHVTVNKYGLVIKIIHYILKTELHESFKTKETDKTDQQLASEFTGKLYSVWDDTVKKAFMKHFGFEDNSVFQVKLYYPPALQNQKRYKDLLRVTKSKGNLQSDSEMEQDFEDRFSEKHKYLLNLMQEVQKLKREKQTNNCNDLKYTLINELNFEKEDVLSVFVLLRINDTTENEEKETKNDMIDEEASVVEKKESDINDEPTKNHNTTDVTPISIVTTDMKTEQSVTRDVIQSSQTLEITKSLFETKSTAF